nr:nonstructural protein 2A [dengue virus type 1]
GSGEVDSFSLGLLCISIMIEEVMRSRWSRKMLMTGTLAVFLLLTMGQLTWNDLIRLCIMVGANASDKMGMGTTYLALMATFRMRPMFAVGLLFRRLTSREVLLLTVGLSLVASVELPNSLEELGDGLAMGIMMLKLLTDFQSHQLWATLLSLTFVKTTFSLHYAWKTMAMILSIVSLFPLCLSTTSQKTTWLPVLLGSLGCKPLTMFLITENKIWGRK